MKEYKPSIRQWPKTDRPREKLCRNGEHTLSDSELLAILLRTGSRGHTALDLARQIFKKFGTFRGISHTDISAWREFKGIGAAKISQIKAAIEIGRRFQEEKSREQGRSITASGDIAAILMPRMRDLKKEIVKAVFLNSRNKVIDIVDVTEGTVNQANPLVREILHKALQHFAVSLVCVHNHPSGDPAPSPEDRRFTSRLCQAGKVLQVNVLDHIIIGDNRYYSFMDRDEM